MIEINIEDTVVKSLFEQLFQKTIGIQITSLDEQDFGQVFKIEHKDIISIEENIEEGFTLWWYKFNPLEGKNVTNSNRFKEFIFI